MYVCLFLRSMCMLFVIRVCVSVFSDKGVCICIFGF